MKKEPKSHYFLVEVIDSPNSEDGETYLKPKEIRESFGLMEAPIGGTILGKVNYLGTKKPKITKP